MIVDFASFEFVESAISASNIQRLIFTTSSLYYFLYGHSVDMSYDITSKLCLTNRESGNSHKGRLKVKIKAMEIVS